MKRYILILFLIFTTIQPMLISAQHPKTDNVITTGSLFKEMIDMKALARYPDPSYRMVQFSSYDHRSQVPGGPDWFANSDGFGGEPTPNFEEVLKAPDESGTGEYLMADLKGPGAIVRLWTASISGQVRLYIDDTQKPLYEGKADPFFRKPYDVLSNLKAIDADRFRKTVYQRDASYAPIPFSKRFRLIWIGNVEEIHFYQIQARLYDQGVRVVTFKSDDVDRYADVIDDVTQALSDPDAVIASANQDHVQRFDETLAPAFKEEILSLDGPGAIERLSLLLQADDMDKALRQTVLSITCDGYPWGQVQSPVGDFFGAAPGINPYQSLPFTVEADGRMTCRFVMPFRDSLRIELENRGGQSVHVSGDVLPADFTWDEHTMYFRARWRVNHDLIASNRAIQDLPFLMARGKGVYVGTTSILLNPTSVPTPGGNWWGEGDEKVFVDDNTHPSLFGTGSEDYYNYSWSAPDIFYFPYCGQPRNDGPGNRGFVTNCRWHILDPIPFEKYLGFYMELFSHERVAGFSYARIGYHYGRPGLMDDHLPLTGEDLRSLSLPEDWHPAARGAARGSIFYPAEDFLTNHESVVIREGRLWADGKILVWKPHNPDDRKDFRLPVDHAGRKRIVMTAALTPQSGRIRVLLNNKSIATDDRPIDLYCPHRNLLRNFFFESMVLDAGEHTLSVEYIGAEHGLHSPEIGIDFFWVQTREK